MKINKSSIFVGVALVALLTLSGCSIPVTEAASEGTSKGTTGEKQEQQESSQTPTQPSSGEGTRANPFSIGTTVKGEDWHVTINKVTFDADSVIAAANQFNSAPDAGYQYILVNATLTYTGDDADGQMPAFVSIDYVTPGGVTVSSSSKITVAPDGIDWISTLYNGASVTGNYALHVPSENASDGVLAIRTGMFSDNVFVATK